MEIEYDVNGVSELRNRPILEYTASQFGRPEDNRCRASRKMAICDAVFKSGRDAKQQFQEGIFFSSLLYLA